MFVGSVLTVAVALPFLLAQPTPQSVSFSIVFPDDPEAVIDAKRDLGAKGDGVHDDTDALCDTPNRHRRHPPPSVSDTGCFPDAEKEGRRTKGRG